MLAAPPRGTHIEPAVEAAEIPQIAAQARERRGKERTPVVPRDDVPHKVHYSKRECTGDKGRRSIQPPSLRKSDIETVPLDPQEAPIRHCGRSTQ